jgi:Icc-related predicted phosphoesterase
VTEHDQEIVREVLTALANELALADLQVEAEAHAGVVDLRGEVDTQDQLDRAARVAASIPGVVEVRNRLTLLQVRSTDLEPEVLWRRNGAGPVRRDSAIRVAAVGDLHCPGDCEGQYRPRFSRLEGFADLLAIAGDLCGLGTPKEAADLVAELNGISLPMVGVLGNHDHHSGHAAEIAKILEDGGITVLDGKAITLSVRGTTVGIVGAKGFGGGFGQGVLTSFGEPLIKAWAEEAAREAGKIKEGLRGLTTNYRLVVLHYAPITETLRGEHPEIYPFLGSSRLSEPIDRHGADLVLHGHAHKGRERGQTETGVPVRNVAVHVLQRHVALYELHPAPREEVAPVATPAHSR